MSIVQQESSAHVRELVKEAIERIVHAAELRAAAAGNNPQVEGNHARMQAEAWAQHNNFSALGIDIPAFIGPNASSKDFPKCSVFVEYLPMISSIQQIENVGNFEGYAEPEEVARSLMSHVLDMLRNVSTKGSPSEDI